MTNRPDPPPAEKPAPRPNKRSSRRQPLKGSTRVRAYRNHLGLGPNIALKILDLSETGVRLVLSEPLALGKEFEINLASIVGSRVVKLLAQVVWIVEAADGSFCVGAHFSKPINYSDLHLMARI